MSDNKINAKTQYKNKKKFHQNLISLGCLGIGYFSPLIAIVMLLFTWKKPEKKIYGKIAGIGGIGAIVMYVLTYVPMLI